MLPIFLSIVGGLIAYFILRNDDPKKAKNCLYLGGALLIVQIAVNVISATFMGDLVMDAEPGI